MTNKLENFSPGTSKGEGTVWKKRLSTLLWFIFAVSIFACLLFLNHHTPLIGEDFAFYLDTQTKDALAKSIVYHILYWFNPANELFNLRLGDILTIVLQNSGNLLGVGKVLFNVLNSIVTLLFFLLIFFWGSCRMPDFKSGKDLAVFSLIPALFLICSPSIGEIFFWFGGSTNYLWAGSILLGLALPYRKYLRDEKYSMNKIAVFFYVPLCYLAGFTNENTVPIVILLGGFLLLRDIVHIAKKQKRIRDFPAWLFLSLLSMGIGYSILLFSPNTQRRVLFYRAVYNLPEKISLAEIQNNTIRVIGSFFSSNFMFLILLYFALAAFFMLRVYKSRHKKSRASILPTYMTAGIFAAILFALSLFRYHRQSSISTFCILVILFFLAVLLLKERIKIKDIHENIFLLSLSAISIIALFFSPYLEIRSFLFVQIFIAALVTKINFEILRGFSVRMGGGGDTDIINICRT